MRIIFMILISCMILNQLSSICFSDDLSDDIPIDENVEEYYQIKKIDKNKQFVILKSTCNASGENTDSYMTNDSTYNNQGGIILTPGSEANGDIILIYNGDNNTMITGGDR